MNLLPNAKQSFQSKGFSLLEILVAMAIVSLLVAVAMPRFGNQGDKIAREEATRLLAAIHMVRDLAVIQDKEFGLTIDENGYHFLVLEPEVDVDDAPLKWKLIEENPALAKHEFAEEVEVNISIDGENLFVKDEDDVNIFEEDVNIFEEEEQEEKVEPPQIYFLSTGEQNQFVIGVASIEAYQEDANEPKFFRIKGELTGVLEYQGPLPGNLFTDILRDYRDFLETDL
ncbi:pilus assembly FimT family protein [Aliikangiella sp. IMCC44632]